MANVIPAFSNLELIGASKGAAYLEKKLVGKAKSTLKDNVYRTAHALNDKYIPGSTETNILNPGAGLAGRGPLYPYSNTNYPSTNFNTGTFPSVGNPSRKYGGVFKTGGWLDNHM